MCRSTLARWYQSYGVFEIAVRNIIKNKIFFKKKVKKNELGWNFRHKFSEWWKQMKPKLQISYQYEQMSICVAHQPNSDLKLKTIIIRSYRRSIMEIRNKDYPILKMLATKPSCQKYTRRSKTDNTFVRRFIQHYPVLQLINEFSSIANIIKFT